MQGARTPVMAGIRKMRLEVRHEKSTKSLIAREFYDFDDYLYAAAAGEGKVRIGKHEYDADPPLLEILTPDDVLFVITIKGKPRIIGESPKENY
jgi:hypothetical protein